jgi:hypothetical protein
MLSHILRAVAGNFVPLDGLISLVGNPTSSTTTSITLPTGLQPNDLVVICSVADSTTQTLPTGYTNGQNGSSNSTEYRWSYKFMGATPDTTATNLASSSAHIAFAFRGVDTASPLDVVSPAISTNTTGMPDPPSITTVTNNSVIVACGFLDDDAVASSVTAPSTYTLLNASQNGATVMAAYKTKTPAGADNPAAFGGSGTDSWVGATFALRPQGLPPNNFTIVGGDVAYTAGATSLSVAYPSGIQANDLLVVVGLVQSATLFGTITGWTNLGSSGAFDVTSWKVADGTESGSVTVNFSGSVAANASMFRIRHSTTNPPTFGTVTGAYATSPSVTLPIPSSYTAVCHILNYRNSGTINGFLPNNRLSLLNSRTTSYAYYGYEIEDAAGQVITSTTTNSVTLAAYTIYV